MSSTHLLETLRSPHCASGPVAFWFSPRRLTLPRTLRRWLHVAPQRLLLSVSLSLGLTCLTSPAQADDFSGPIPAPPSNNKPVPIEAFFDVLRDWGTFIDTDRYGVVFCPHPDLVGPDFQPYMRGHWVMSEYGWTFTSDLKISWVTDHYGRWVETGLSNCNWGWVPGGDWAPAWVDFRVGDKIVAWRPKAYDGPRVQLNRSEAQRFPRFSLPQQSFSSDTGFVAVREGEFQARRLDYVALTGVKLYQALRDSEPLTDVHAGLLSAEHDRIVARIQERKEAQLAASGAAGKSTTGKPIAGAGSGEPFSSEPAQRKRKGGSGAGTPAAGTTPAVAGAAGTVRAGLPGAEPPKPAAGKEKLNLVGAQPGQTPPDRTNMTTGSSAGSPGQFSGAKVFEFDKPKPQLMPKTVGPTVNRSGREPNPELLKPDPTNPK